MPGPAQPEASLEERADAAYGTGDLDGAIAAWERLHTLRAEEGDAAGAAFAASRVALYLLIDSGLMATVRGWVRRAERWLPAVPAADPVRALVAMVQGYERFFSGDPTGARHHAERAVDLGERLGSLPAVVVGRTALGRLQILDGEVTGGLALLDEVAALLMSGDVDPLTTGMMYCEIICAAQSLGMPELAREWTELMDRWAQEAAFGALHGRCRVHRAELMRLSGPADLAEEEALLACAELRPWLLREYGWPLVELGTIRLQRGDLPGAEEAFLAAHQHVWSPQPGLALLRLAEGHVQVSLDLITESVERPDDNPSKEQPAFGELRLAPLLAAQVQIAVAAGRPDLARTASARLDAIASDFSGVALLASARLARARSLLASGEVDAARTEAGAAVRAWADLGAPYEAAQARLVLAEAHHRCGAVANAELEWAAAAAGFESFGAPVPAVAAHPPGASSAGPVAPPRSVDAVLEPAGALWRVGYGEQESVLPDLKGLRYLCRLLAAPGRELHVLDLVGAEGGGADTVRGVQASGLPVLDDEARAAYRRRLAEVEEDLAEATSMNDLGRVELAERDRDYLVAELTAAAGLGGRGRTTGSTVERARGSVTRSLRYAIARLSESLPALGQHLSGTVRTGTWCRYEPDPLASVRWRLGGEQQ